jgi:hypothetical protein
LDEKSKAVVDGKVDDFLNFPIYHEEYRCLAKSRKYLYTDEEEQENEKFLMALPGIKERYRGDFGTYTPESFFYHHGLMFLECKALDYIKDSIFLDVGAFKGESSIVFSEYNPAEVYAIEALAELEEVYYKNIELNNLNRYQYHFLNTHISSIKPIPRLPGGGIRLVKLDIEGAEFDAIVGARDLIERERPILLISIYHTPTEFFELKPLIESWNLDYGFMIRNLSFFWDWGSCKETELICVPKTVLL